MLIAATTVAELAYPPIVLKDVVVALITVGGTQFVTYLISRQNANDLRVNISREIEIIRKLQPGTEASTLEAHVKAGVAKLIYRDEGREQLLEVLWRFAPLILVSAAGCGLQLWRHQGVPAMLGPAVAILYYGLVAMTGWLFLRYVWGLLKLAYGYTRFYTRLGLRWTQIRALRIKHWWLKRKIAKRKEQLTAVIDIAEDLLDAAEQASGSDEQAQTARKKAVDTTVRRLAEIGVTLKSRPIPHY
jgi:hypothetical protein